MSGATRRAHRVTLPKIRMRESRTSGSVRRAPGDRRLYSTSSKGGKSELLGRPTLAGYKIGVTRFVRRPAILKAP